jgi:tetratricopeptide (TPR) repeat protein
MRSLQAIGEDQRALVIHSQAASHARKWQNFAEEGRAYRQIGSICIACNQFDDAITHFKQALSCAQQEGSDSSAMIAFGRLGLTYFMLSRASDSKSSPTPKEHLQTATRMFQQQHVLATKLGDLEEIGHCW